MAQTCNDAGDSAIQLTESIESPIADLSTQIPARHGWSLMVDNFLVLIQAVIKLVRLIPGVQTQCSAAARLWKRR